MNEKWLKLSKISIYISVVLFIIVMPLTLIGGYWWFLPIMYILSICDLLLINDNVKDKGLLILYKVLIGVALLFINMLILYLAKDHISNTWEVLIIQVCCCGLLVGLDYIAYFIMKENE